MKYGKFPSKLLHITKKKILKLFGALIKGQQPDFGHEWQYRQYNKIPLIFLSPEYYNSQKIWTLNLCWHMEEDMVYQDSNFILKSFLFGNSHSSSNSIWSEQEHVFSKLSGVVQLTGGKSNQPEHPSPIFATECLPLFPLAFLCNSFLSKPPCGMWTMGGKTNSSQLGPSSWPLISFTRLVYTYELRRGSKLGFRT